MILERGISPVKGLFVATSTLGKLFQLNSWALGRLVVRLFKFGVFLIVRTSLLGKRDFTVRIRLSKSPGKRFYH